MPKVTTGFNPWLGSIGTARVHELLRQGVYAHAEQTNDPVTTGYPRTLKIIRRVQTAAGSTAAGIPATWATVAGLSAIPGVVHLPETWDDQQEADITLREAERVVTLVDIPATTTEGEDVLLLSDRVAFDDPTYGADAVFEIVQIRPAAAGVTRAVVRYAHADEAV